jgi:hypothetical protein
MIKDIDSVNSDGVTVSKFRLQSDGMIHREIVQPDRDLILANNAELRKNKGVIRDLSFARLALRVPLVDMYALKEKYPILANGSNEEIKRFWHRFIKTSEAEPYKVY